MLDTAYLYTLCSDALKSVVCRLGLWGFFPQCDLEFPEIPDVLRVLKCLLFSKTKYQCVCIYIIFFLPVSICTLLECIKITCQEVKCVGSFVLFNPSAYPMFSMIFGRSLWVLSASED